MLEQWYWIAGIVVALAAVIGLFVKERAKKSVSNQQNANVSGQHNRVNQTSEIKDGERKDD